MDAKWIVTVCFTLLGWLSHCQEKSTVPPVDCVNTWPRSLCNSTLKTYGKGICTSDHFFGRYECCVTCAEVLHITVDKGKFEGKNNFTYYHPKCPNPTDATMATGGESWESWCKQWITEEEGPTICQMPLIQYRCYKTCNVACKP
ncbi:hypothetical protein TTRE_0000760301 [Trichuris trichiura]|uniref:Uncharacterized protein n=1 Tax=Trichuris trichiura TaxID=36087 RepID=A0A077ZFW5_TRITR|nr:hypothetical protein TTRE_0000760301 [Trichuris trichiura]